MSQRTELCPKTLPKVGNSDFVKGLNWGSEEYVFEDEKYWNHHNKTNKCTFAQNAPKS